MKGVPTSYGSDLHELKGVYMRSLDELRACLRVFPHFIAGLEPDRKRATALLGQGHILATEAADELARLGVPFRQAYSQIAALVEKAEARGIQIQDLPETDWRAIAPELPAKFALTLNAENAVARRRGPGGTSLQSSAHGLAELKKRAGI
jgi:argininosuccinate lyase